MEGDAINIEHLELEGRHFSFFRGEGGGIFFWGDFYWEFGYNNPKIFINKHSLDLKEAFL